MTNYCGNKVDVLTDGFSGDLVFDEAPYYFAVKQLSADENFRISGLGCFTAFVLGLDAQAALRCEELDCSLEPNSALRVENEDLTLSTAGGGATLLIAGAKRSSLERTRQYLKLSEFKQVQKPWGHELWISGEHPSYAFKQIFVRAGHKLSLQYHRIKCETQILVAGRARLHYLEDAAVPLERATVADTTTLEISPITINRVSANVLHRLEAVTDATFYETSTPHLDDVVRVADDTNRADGRIDAEHG